MAGAPQPNQELITWVQIAEYLKVSVRQAQILEKSEGLPVRRLGNGKKPGVSALVEDLDRWKADRLARAMESAAATEPRTSPTPAPPLLYDTLGVSAVPGTAGTVAAAPNLRQRLSQRRWLASIGIFGIFLIASVIYWLLAPHGQMIDFRVDGPALIGLNEKKQELWRHTFPRDLRPDFYERASRWAYTWLGDLDGNGKKSLIFAAILLQDAAPIQDQLLCFDDRGQMKWKKPFTPGRSVKDSGGIMVPPFSIFQILIMRRQTADETRVVISSVHHSDQPCQVAILDRHGRVLAEYWHPGHLNHMIEADLDADGRNELLLGGVNNGEHRATVVVLDPWKMSGLSTPAAMTDDSFRLLDMPAANEKAVILFPRSSISVGQSYTRVQALNNIKGRLQVAVAEGTNQLGPGFIYELDYSLRPISVVAGGDNVKRAHEALEAAGKLHHSYTSDSWASLKDHVEVRWGK